MSNVNKARLQSLLKISRSTVVLLIVIGGIFVFVWYKFDYMPAPTIQISSAGE